MDSTVYHRLREKAAEAAERIGLPSFYREHKRELEISSAAYASSGLLRRCKSRVDTSALHPAHGMDHCEKVAIEAGALVQIENRTDETAGLMTCAHIAGLFHDIKRAGPDHSVAGSIEAERILRDFDVESRYLRYVAAAIRNHEAFREVIAPEDERAKLLSDTLYDADKFRWGPDNFTITLWLMVESAKTPAKSLYSNFRENMKVIDRIRNTFRTATGRKHGPEFIDFGMEIGKRIYSELKQIIRD